MEIEYKSLNINGMSNKIKSSKKHNLAKHDREDNRKFLMVLAIATLVLMLLMYIIYVR